MSDATNGHVPPQRGRINAASFAGLFPRSQIFVSGVTLLGAALGLILVGQGAVDFAVALMKESLETAVSFEGFEPATVLLDAVARAGFTLIPLFLIIFAAASVASVVPALIARRGKGQTSVPLPKEPKASWVMAIVNSFASVVLFLVFLSIARQYWTLGSGDYVGGVAKILAAAGAIALVTGIIEMSIKKHLIWKALHIDTSGARLERRASGDENIASNALKAKHREGSRI